MKKKSGNNYFRRILPRHLPARSLLWTAGMVIVIIWLMYYLNKIVSTG
ncbi:MAG: hypothetical protein V3S48_00620 [Candidatus Neomarinimicrobiota bacterium]